MKSLILLLAFAFLFVTTFLSPLIVASPNKQDWDLEVASAKAENFARDVQTDDPLCDDWLLLYCDKPYDPTEGICGGKCSPWDRNSYTLRNAPGTECIAIRPSNVNFTACNGIIANWRTPSKCTRVNDWKDEHKYLGIDGFTFFDAPGTNTISVMTCDPSSSGTTESMESTSDARSIDQIRDLSNKTGQQDCQMSLWHMVYCNKPFDPQKGKCGGKCTSWDPSSPMGVELNAPGTNCIGVSPPNAFKFEACNGRGDGIDSPGATCTSSTDWKVQAIHQGTGLLYYDAPGTRFINVEPCTDDNDTSNGGKTRDLEYSRHERDYESASVARDVKAGFPPDCPTWILLYCNGPYDDALGKCSGKCSFVDQNSQWNLRNAPGTQCIGASPFNLNFSACNTVLNGHFNAPGRCTNSLDMPHTGLPGLDPFFFYDVPGTNSIEIFSCYPDGDDGNRRSIDAGITDKREITNGTDVKEDTDIAPVEHDGDSVSLPCRIPNYWKLIYCNGGYDTTTRRCGGKCSYWSNKLSIAIEAPGTNCIAVTPMTTFQFVACNSNDKCTQSARWPINKKYTAGLIEVFDAPGTQYIQVQPCLRPGMEVS